MKDYYKNEKGGVSIYVLVTMLILIIILMGIYNSKINKQITQLEVAQQIKSTYEEDTNNVDDIYNHLTGNSTTGGEGEGTGGPSTIPGKVSSITVKLADGMVPVVYNTSDKSWYVATKEQIYEDTWFNYVDTSVSGKANSSQWANII